MAETLQTLQEKIASLVDQSVTPPTAGGSEWNVRKTFINRAIQEWGDAYDWEALRAVWWFSASGISGASVALPTTFRKMAAKPLVYQFAGETATSEDGEEWDEIMPGEVGEYTNSHKHYYILGDSGNGFNMIWNPGTLSSGASIMFQYYKKPTELSAAVDVSECLNPEFLIDRAIALIFEARSDARFQEMETKAREKLLQMVDDENTKSRAYDNRVKTPEERIYHFRVGRD